MTKKNGSTSRAVEISPQLGFFISLAKAQSIASRRIGNKLSGWGLGWNDFIILFHLSQAQGEKLRRTDLADKVGLTASGVTRLLAPMEKIGLVKRELDAHDGRVSMVALAPGGRRLFVESLVNAEYISEEWLAQHKVGKIEDLAALVDSIGSFMPQ